MVSDGRFYECHGDFEIIRTSKWAEYQVQPIRARLPKLITSTYGETGNANFWLNHDYGGTTTTYRGALWLIKKIRKRIGKKIDARQSACEWDSWLAQQRKEKGCA